jgi:hypothetical protein
MSNPRSISLSLRGAGWSAVRSLDTLSRSLEPLSRASDTAFLTTLAEYSSHRSSRRFRMNSSTSLLSKYSCTASPTWCLNSHSVSIGPYTALDVAGSYPRGATAAAAAEEEADPGSDAAAPLLGGIDSALELSMYLPSSSSYSGSLASTGTWSA